MSSYFQVSSKVYLSARPSNKEKKDFSRPAYFNPQEKRQLLDLMNEEVKKCKTLLPLVAEALGKTDQLDDSSDVSVVSLISGQPFVFRFTC